MLHKLLLNIAKALGRAGLPGKAAQYKFETK